MNRPNILFITAEDMCPHLGCYQDPNAKTPHIDQFAKTSTIYTNMYSVHPCCSPSRSSLMTGIYPTRLGTMQHRGTVSLNPEDVRTLSSILREHGYYTFNGFGCEGGSAKEDYNFKPKDNPWDAYNTKEWEWHNREENQPFFGQVNFFQTHQSQYGLREPFTGTYDIHHPNELILPSYHPDLPAVREIWCEYYERIHLMDHYFGKLIAQLKKDQLDTTTIVIFLGDNGMGIPGGKVWTWEQGLHVPFIVHFPEAFQHLNPNKRISNQMVSFIDFAPTILSWCNINQEAKMQGQPLSNKTQRDYIFAARDLHEDSDHDFTRVVRNKDFHYIRNFMPHIGWEAMPYSWSRAPHMLHEMYQAAKDGKLDTTNRQSCFFTNEKLVEELYDVKNDPAQINNLALDPNYQEILNTMRTECYNWIINNHDLGFLSQKELYQRSKEIRTYNMASNPKLNPIKTMLEAANIANERNIKNLPKIKTYLKDEDEAIRRWGVIGLTTLREQSEETQSLIIHSLSDTSSDVRRIAAEKLLSNQFHQDAFTEIIHQLKDTNGIVRYHALLSISRLYHMLDKFLPYLENATSPCENRNWGSYDNVEAMVSIIKDMYHNTKIHKVEPKMFDHSFR